MEKLERETPVAKLSEAQRQRLAEIDDKFKARIAEKELFLGGLIVKAKEAGNPAEVAELEEQLARELARIRERCEAEKEDIRAQR